MTITIKIRVDGEMFKVRTDDVPDSLTALEARVRTALEARGVAPLPDSLALGRRLRDGTWVPLTTDNAFECALREAVEDGKLVLSVDNVALDRSEIGMSSFIKVGGESAAEEVVADKDQASEAEKQVDSNENASNGNETPAGDDFSVETKTAEDDDAKEKQRTVRRRVMGWRRSGVRRSCVRVCGRLIVLMLLLFAGISTVRTVGSAFSSGSAGGMATTPAVQFVHFHTHHYAGVDGNPRFNALIDRVNELKHHRKPIPRDLAHEFEQLRRSEMASASEQRQYVTGLEKQIKDMHAQRTGFVGRINELENTLAYVQRANVALRDKINEANGATHQSQEVVKQLAGVHNKQKQTIEQLDVEITRCKQDVRLNQDGWKHNFERQREQLERESMNRLKQREQEWENEKQDLMRRLARAETQPTYVDDDVASESDDDERDSVLDIISEASRRVGDRLSRDHLGKPLEEVLKSDSLRATSRKVAKNILNSLNELVGDDDDDDDDNEDPKHKFHSKNLHTMWDLEENDKKAKASTKKPTASKNTKTTPKSSSKSSSKASSKKKGSLPRFLKDAANQAKKRLRQLRTEL